MNTRAERHDGPKLWLIRSDNRNEVSLGDVRVVAAPRERPPFAIDAMVFEEDTYLLLSVEPDIHEPVESIGQLVGEAIKAHPSEPGSVLVKGGSPLRFLAIVHNLDKEPSWREEWVGKALEGVLRESERRGLRSIGLPFLGTLHGSLEKERFLVLLRSALERVTSTHPERIWLMEPEAEQGTLWEMFGSGEQG